MTHANGRKLEVRVADVNIEGETKQESTDDEEGIGAAGVTTESTKILVGGAMARPTVDMDYHSVGGMDKAWTVPPTGTQSRNPNPKR